MQWTLRCDPSGGTLPKRAAACQKLDTMKNPFLPMRKDLECTQVYGGPEQAVITGRYEGRPVWVLLARRNGCEIAAGESWRSSSAASARPGSSKRRGVCRRRAQTARIASRAA